MGEFWQQAENLATDIDAYAHVLAVVVEIVVAKKVVKGLGRGKGGPQGLSKKKPVVVMGETMDTRVNVVADNLRKAGYEVHTYSPKNFRSYTTKYPGLHPLDMKANRSWLKYWTKGRGAQVVDIGIDVLRSKKLGRSAFYLMENRSIYQNWNYKNVIKFNPGF